LNASEADAPVAAALASQEKGIGFSQATFAWSSEQAIEGDFKLVIKDRLLFEKGKINLVVGPTGSGKTSLLLALLGKFILLAV
jgi:ABC-type multidrug transport system fused ATPase/permease subunit